jgi:hypothetical protein
MRPQMAEAHLAVDLEIEPGSITEDVKSVQ